MTKIMSIDALNRRLGFSGYEGRPVFDCTQEMAAVREIAAKLGREPNLSEIPDKIGIMLWLAGGDKQGVRELISAASQMPAAGAEPIPAEEAEAPAAADAEPADATPAAPDAGPQDHGGAPKAEARSRGFVAMLKRKISRG
jgi:hypothetical protein